MKVCTSGTYTSNVCGWIHICTEYDSVICTQSAITMLNKRNFIVFIASPKRFDKTIYCQRIKKAQMTVFFNFKTITLR